MLCKVNLWGSTGGQTSQDQQLYMEFLDSDDQKRFGIQPQLMLAQEAKDELKREEAIPPQIQHWLGTSWEQLRSSDHA